MKGQINMGNVSPQGVGVADGDLGTILQRGGEELRLEKAGDRFTVRLADPEERLPHYPATQQQPIRGTNLLEVRVEPSHLEEEMQAARNQEGIAFVSHVYMVVNNPGMLAYLTSELTIQFANTVAEAIARELASSVGIELVRPLEEIPNTYICEATLAAIENPIKIANRLMRQSEVLAAEPNIVITSQNLYTPRDTLYHKQWYLNNNGGFEIASNSHINVEKAWDITRGTRQIVVAIVDDSVDINHPDFQGSGKIVAPRDLKEKDFVPLPGETTDNHGTACAGVAIAEENGTGVVGVAPGCALMPIRSTGFLDDKTIEDIFDWSMSKGASVISCSWGPSSVYFPISLRQSAAISRAATKGRNGKGCVVVFAAGNANRPTKGTVDEDGWPQDVIQGRTQWLNGFAVHPDVITVSACTSLNKKAAYSNWGKSISVCAPSNNAPPGMWLQETGYTMTPPRIRTSFQGQGVFTADRLGAAGYSSSDFTSTFGGTSSACPVVAGVAALVLSVNPNLTAAQVKAILQQSADKIIDSDADRQFGLKLGNYDASGHSEWFGYGKVNAYGAVVLAQRMLRVSQQVSRWIRERFARSQTIPDYQKPRSGLFGVSLLRGSQTSDTTSSISFSDPSFVRDIRVNVEIEHGFLGDLEIYLVAPNGNKVLIQGRTLGRKTRLQKFYSKENTPILQQLFNQPAQGTWKLQVVDRASSDTGTLKSWELSLGI
ncbi:MAG: S8 family serine peptidase [Oscillatoria sp. SIO1A7]|nr:S8 family serine peptidase [Oscillatoria sp. SIO1A7]